MRAMILAAGRGQRLSPLTDTRPKPLIEVGGKALIEHQLSALRTSGFREVVINSGWLGQQLIKQLGTGGRFGLRIEYSIEPQSGLETGGGIFQALPLLGDEPFLVINADIYHEISFHKLRKQAEQLSDKTLVHLVLVKKPEYVAEGDFCLSKSLVLAKENTQTESYTYTGIGIYRPQLFNGLKSGRFSSVPLIKAAIQKSRVNGELSTAAWFDAGTQERIETIEQFIRSS